MVSQVNYFEDNKREAMILIILSTSCLHKLITTVSLITPNFISFGGNKGGRREIVMYNYHTIQDI